MGSTPSGCARDGGELWLRTGVRGRHAALGGPNKSKLCFFGMELRRYKQGVFLSRTGYLVETLKCHGVQGAEAFTI